MTVHELAKAAAIKAIQEDRIGLYRLDTAADALKIARKCGEEGWWLTDEAQIAVAGFEFVQPVDAREWEECGLAAVAKTLLTAYLAK